MRMKGNPPLLALFGRTMSNEFFPPQALTEEEKSLHLYGPTKTVLVVELLLGPE